MLRALLHGKFLPWAKISGRGRAEILQLLYGKFQPRSKNFQPCFALILNPFEFLTHLKKHQNLMTLAHSFPDLLILPNFVFLKSLFEDSIFALQLAKHLTIKVSSFCTLSHRNLVLEVNVLLLLVLLLAKSTITCSLASEAMFIYEKVLMRTRKLFSISG